MNSSGSSAFTRPAPAEIGLLAVLHTWGPNLHHHPHVHCVCPAAVHRSTVPDGWVAVGLLGIAEAYGAGESGTRSALMPI
jgi:Putative transposase